MLYYYGLYLLEDSVELQTWIFLYMPLYYHVMNENKDPSSATDTILSNCREGLKRIPLVSTYREANKWVDNLARRGVNLY